MSRPQSGHAHAWGGGYPLLVVVVTGLSSPGCLSPGCFVWPVNGLTSPVVRLPCQYVVTETSNHTFWYLLLVIKQYAIDISFIPSDYQR
jgi:hypothetical protein